MKPQLLNYIEAWAGNKCSGASMCRRILKDTTCPLIKITAKWSNDCRYDISKGQEGNLRAVPGSQQESGNHGLQGILQIAAKSLEITRARGKANVHCWHYNREMKNIALSHMIWTKVWSVCSVQSGNWENSPRLQATLTPNNKNQRLPST